MVNFTGGLVKCGYTYIPTSNVALIREGRNDSQTIVSLSNPFEYSYNGGYKYNTLELNCKPYTFANAFETAEQNNIIISID